MEDYTSLFSRTPNKAKSKIEILLKNSSDVISK
jgi:hypothetical protein